MKTFIIVLKTIIKKCLEFMMTEALDLFTLFIWKLPAEPTWAIRASYKLTIDTLSP